MKNKKQYYCKEIDCNNQICYKNYKYGLGRCSSCSKKGKKAPFFGKLHTKETKLKIRNSKYHQNLKEKNNPNYIDGRTNKKYYCKDCNKKICLLSALYGQSRCKSCAAIYRWQNKEFKEKNVKAMFEGMKISPNKPEKCLIKLLPKTYKFVGDGKLIIGGLCPDFVNKDNNKIIELYGDYWHKRPEVIERDKRRIKTYKKYGYKMLVIWEHELKNLNKVKNKIKEFNYACYAQN